MLNFEVLGNIYIQTYSKYFLIFTFVIAVGDVLGYIRESGRKLYHETLQVRQ